MTALNCKPGDLAIVVATELPENLGQIVEVLGIQTGKPLDLPDHGHVWQVRTVSGRKTLIYRVATVTRPKRFHHAEGPAPDRCLRPVSGLTDGDAASDGSGVQRAVPATTVEPSFVRAPDLVS